MTRISDMPVLAQRMVDDDLVPVVSALKTRRASLRQLIARREYSPDQFGTITLGVSVADAAAVANRRAIQAAIDAAVAAGGGVVVLPVGDIAVRGSFDGYVPRDTINGSPWPYDGPVHHLRIGGSHVTVSGHGMGCSRLLSSEPSTMFTAHHDGALAGIVLEDFSCVNRMGLQTQFSTMGIYWCGRIVVRRVEWLDWSMCCYGVGATPGCEFVRGRYLWTRGREGIGYTGHSSNFHHPCVGIMWPGDFPTISDNYFNGQLVSGFLSRGEEPETLPIDWTPGPGDLRAWPDVCRQSADGLVIHFNGGGTISGNRIYSNGIEGILVDYNADLTDTAAPVAITGNVVDSLHWRGKLSINYPAYGIVVNHRSCLSLSGNSVNGCDVGLSLNACQGVVSDNAMANVLHGAWIMACTRMAVKGNTIDCKPMEAGDILAQYNCERGLFIGTPGSMLIEGNVITGPTSGWKVGEMTVSHAYTQGDLRVYLNTTDGLIYGIPMERDGSWLALDYAPAVSLGWAFPVQAIGVDPVLGPWVEMPNTDWSNQTPSMAAGTVLSQFNDGPGRVAGVIVTKPTDDLVRVANNTIKGFIYGVASDQPDGRPVDLFNNAIQAGHARTYGRVTEMAFDGAVPLSLPIAQTNGLQAGIRQYTETTNPIPADQDIAVWSGSADGILVTPSLLVAWRIMFVNASAVTLTVMRNGATGSLDGAPTITVLPGEFVLLQCLGDGTAVRLGGSTPRYRVQVFSATTNPMPIVDVARWTGGAGGILVCPPFDITWRITFINETANALTIMRQGTTALIAGAPTYSLAAGQTVTLQCLGNDAAVIIP